MFKWLAKIYVLTDKDNNPFYVGSTVQSLEKRLVGHLFEARKDYRQFNKLKNEKIKSLNFEVSIKTVFCFTVSGKTSQQAQKRCIYVEENCINKFISEGYDLCNISMRNNSTR